VNVSYSDVKGGKPYVFRDLGCTLNWDDGNNIQVDPCFVTGPLGSYYLSQTDTNDPNQTADSPCVDTGSDQASNVGLSHTYTTRTDEVFDTMVVDMGYHYPLAHPIELCSFCDLSGDGVVNLVDFAIFSLYWLNEDCSDDNDWCGGADLTFDSHVNFGDLAFLYECWLAEDTDAPLPNPSEWEIAPYSTTVTPPYKISMTAEAAFDSWGGVVEYYFECVTGNDSNSVWDPNRTYPRTSLNRGTVYGYRVKASDERGNETLWSAIGYAVAGQLSPDHNPPTPDPMTWATMPYATSPTSIAMVATTATDDTAGVEYYFEDVNSDVNSGWQSSPTWVDTTCEPNTTYTYRVRARDTSINWNETMWSTLAAATTPAEDLTPPTPNPMTWATAPYATSPTSVSMVATTATDASGVEYYFEDFNIPAVNSGWQDSPIYAVTVAEGALYTFVVRARDKSPNRNTTGDSAAVAADPDAPTPNPMTWAVGPYRASSTSISMTASVATDASGVEYYFQCTSHSQYSSGWRTGQTYTVGGLPGGLYTFVVRARDGSPNRNTTGDSAAVAVDLDPPTPVAWALTTPTPPYETGSGENAYAHMTAQVAIDPEGNGPVQYYFQCIDVPGIFSGICGIEAVGYSSGWINDPQWDVCIGRAGQGLEFHFRVRDNLGNTSGWSTTRYCYPP
jgi:hypothetical protein